MIIERQVWQVLGGQLQAAAEAVRDESAAVLAESAWGGLATRVYTSMFGPEGQVAIEWTYDSMASREEGWDAWMRSGRVPAFMEKWRGPIDTSISAEVLLLDRESTVAGEKNTIALRWTRIPGKFQDEALRNLWAKWVIEPGEYTARLMMPTLGHLARVILEVEYADMADYQARMGAWLSRPENPEFWEAFHAITLPGGSNEVWRLVQ